MVYRLGGVGGFFQVDSFGNTFLISILMFRERNREKEIEREKEGYKYIIAGIIIRS